MQPASRQRAGNTLHVKNRISSQAQAHARVHGAAVAKMRRQQRHSSGVPSAISLQLKRWQHKLKLSNIKALTQLGQLLSNLRQRR